MFPESLLFGPSSEIPTFWPLHVVQLPLRLRYISKKGENNLGKKSVYNHDLTSVQKIKNEISIIVSKNAEDQALARVFRLQTLSGGIGPWTPLQVATFFISTC